MANKHSLIRNLLVNNKRLKALSFLLATLTWYIIQDAISFEIEIPGVRLEVQVQDGNGHSEPIRLHGGCHVPRLSG